MRIIKCLLLTIIALSFSNCNKTKTSNNSDVIPKMESREYYQLKVYTFDTDSQVTTTDKYLKEAYLPALKKLGINNIGVFKPIMSETDSIKSIYVLIPFTSMEQFLTLEDNIHKDSTYLLTGNSYINVNYDKQPYQRIESTLMMAFTDMPQMRPSKLESPRAERVYELRSYQSATEQYFKNKVDMFNAGGEVKLFEKLEFNAVFYAEVISGSKMPNLMYMTPFDNQTSRDEHWQAFGDSPEWTELKTIEKYQNNVSHIDIVFLYPTDYSDY
ncbi:NIPSNAP protein [Flaviramulus basaltis]|uniref:NIPSNAP protein n=1 Tax=Flaviramulus basaltis TaxID=369401 RepID=A0A1K2IH90_9FLAO|nr:NIPSNAP family protein [Flaviramulus basaltis]SFZ91793.1 NIPSNAP protein [Flaviramulus basaltis]